jgi:AcrR family transcriptional regulator
MNRGERIANRTKSALKNALLELVREKNYPDITVSEITHRGNIGRSTLYKHYKSKADVLVDIHTDMFAHLFSALTTSESWFSSEPSSELILFFKRSRQLGINPFSLSYKLGSDLDYLISHIHLRLTATIEKSLYNSFNDADSSIPLPILARAVSHVYSGLIVSWFTNYQSFDVRQFATHIQRMTRALVVEAIGVNAT